MHSIAERELVIPSSPLWNTKRQHKHPTGVWRIIWPHNLSPQLLQLILVLPAAYPWTRIRLQSLHFFFHALSVHVWKSEATSFHRILVNCAGCQEVARMEFVISRSPLSYCEDASKAVLQDDLMQEPKKVLEGSPVLSSDVLSVAVTDRGLVVARGLMKCTPGKYKDVVEDDDFFTIINGKATVEFVNSDQVLELEEGTVGELRKGSEVIYTVHETLLKSSQLSMSSDEGESNGIEAVKAEQEFSTSSYAVPARTVTLKPEELQQDVSWTCSDPSPELTSAILSSLDGGRVVRGLWRSTAGSCCYVEDDELFTVLAGRATVKITAKQLASPNTATRSSNSGSPSLTGEERQTRTLQLERGMVGEFKAGDLATFTVQGEEPFLKSFQITCSSSAAVSGER